MYLQIMDQLSFELIVMFLKTVLWEKHRATRDKNLFRYSVY